MRTLPTRFAARFLPKGWRDLGVQILLFCGAYWLYRLVRGLTDGKVARGVRERARADPARAGPRPVHRAGRARVGRGLRRGSSTARAGCTSTRTSRSPRSRSRSSTCGATRASTSSATCSWSRWGSRWCSTPRTRPRRRASCPSGASRTPSRSSPGLTSEGSSADALYNPFAAVPSMHVAFALMLGLPMAHLARRRTVKVLWLLYPLLVSFVVVATANHWWFDAFSGAVTAAVAAGAAVLFARWRPDRVGLDRRPSGGRRPAGRLAVPAAACPPRRSNARAVRRRATTRCSRATGSSSRASRRTRSR